MGVPYCRRVFQDGAYIGLICLFLDVSRASPQIASEKAECAVAFLAHGMDVGFPAKISVEGDAKVLSLISSPECCPMDGIGGCSDDVLPLVGNPQHFTFVGIEGHEPCLLPLLDTGEIPV